MFRKMFLIICFFFFPFFVLASPVSDQYELIISEEFLDYMNEYRLLSNPSLEQEMIYYQKSGFSIRDYLLFENCRDFINGEENVFKVSSIPHYYYFEQDKSFDLLEGYSSLRIEFVPYRELLKKTFDFSSFEDFLDNNMLHYFLFQKYLSSDDSCEFQRVLNSSYYGKIVSKSKTLLLIQEEYDGGISHFSFIVPKDVTIQDNLSLAQFNSSTSELEYVPIVFSNKLTQDEIVNPKTFFNQWIVFIGIIFLFITLIFLLVPFSVKK